MWSHFISHDLFATVRKLMYTACSVKAASTLTMPSLRSCRDSGARDIWRRVRHCFSSRIEKIREWNSSREFGRGARDPFSNSGWWSSQGVRPKSKLLDFRITWHMSLSSCLTHNLKTKGLRTTIYYIIKSRSYCIYKFLILNYGSLLKLTVATINQFIFLFCFIIIGFFLYILRATLQ